MSEFKISPNRQMPNAGAVSGKTKKPNSSDSGSQAPVIQPNSADQLLFSALPDLANPQLDQKILIDILKKLEVDLFQNQLSGETSIIKSDQERVQDLSKNNQKKLVDMLKKVEAQNKSGLIGKIFGWIGAVLGVVLGVVFAIVSFGSGAPLAGTLIAISVTLAVTMVIMSASGGMDKLTAALAEPLAKMMETMGMDAKKAKQVAQIMAQVIVTVVVIAVQIALAIASGGSNVANFTSELANKIASITMKIANFAIAADQLAGAGAATASGAYHYESLIDQADMMQNKAMLKKMQTIIDSEQEMIKEILQELMGVQKNMGQMIKDENENRGILADIDTQPSAV